MAAEARSHAPPNAAPTPPHPTPEPVVVLACTVLGNLVRGVPPGTPAAAGAPGGAGESTTSGATSRGCSAHDVLGRAGALQVLAAHIQGHGSGDGGSGGSSSKVGPHAWLALACPQRLGPMHSAREARGSCAALG